MRSVILFAVGCAADGPVAIGPTGSTSTGDPCLDAACIPDPEPDEIRVGWAQVVVAHDGSAWISWTQNEGSVATALYVARSPAAGEPFSAPIEVPVPEPPLVDVTEKPSLAVAGDRLALAYTGNGMYRHGDAHAAYVQTGTWSGDQVTFDAAVRLDLLEPEDLVMEMARVALGPDGEVWAVWKRQQYGVLDQSVWARESTGYEPLPVGEGELSVRHDCSPPELRMGSSGPLLAVRSNVEGWLETMVVPGTPDGFGAPAQVSDDDWLYDPSVCPSDGPRVVELPDGTLVSSWIAPDPDTWRMRTAVSSDGGASWSDPVIDAETTFGENWVALAAGDDGRLYTAGEGLDGVTQLRVREVPLGEYETRTLSAPTGSELADVELAAGPGRVVALGVDDDRFLWLLDL